MRWAASVGLGLSLLGANGCGSGGGDDQLASMWVPTPGPYPAYVVVMPSRVTVQVGSDVTFKTVGSSGTYQWLRDGVEIRGATLESFTINGVSMGDDRARISARVTAINGTATDTATLQVSPFPAVVFEDGEFVSSNWTVVASSSDPASDGPQYAITRPESGGNPGAFRRIDYSLAPGPSSIAVQQMSKAVYDPLVHGSIYAIDIRTDCMVSAGETSVALLLEQAGRRFATKSASCGAWMSYFALDKSFESMDAASFAQVGGDACAGGQPCLDFSASGAPIRFGLLTGARIASGSPGIAVQSIDNWKVTVWRK